MPIRRQAEKLVQPKIGNKPKPPAGNAKSGIAKNVGRSRPVKK